MAEEQKLDEEIKNEADIDVQENTQETVEENEASQETTEEAAEAQEADTEEAEGEPAEGKKKGFFSKKKDKKDEKIEELTDQYKRTLAEFDNFRKRTEKEKAAMFEIGAKSVIEKLLPVVDNFERGLATIPEEDKGTPFADGMDKIYKQLLKQLEDMGVKEIEAMDKEFDPNLHNAVMHVDDENVGENIIVEVFQKGYTYKESVVRHSMVKVAN